MSMFPDDMFAPDPLAEIAEEKTLQLKDGERRNVAILFADLKGFTAMSEKLDPEFVQSTIDKIMSVFTQVIKSHGGYVDKYSGDEIMALFGAKVASEVDTERAIRSGLKMLENLEKFNEYMKRQSEFDVIKEPIGIRIGINTGLVTTGKIGEGREGDFTAYGDTVNLASRLESNAPVNSIMVPESIEKVLTSHFEFIDEGNIKVKGKTDPISVFTIGKIKEITSAGKDKYSTKFVGRENELKQLHSAYEAAVDNVGSDDCHASMVTISADGGIGKTRLLHEFIHQTLPDARSSNYLSVGRATNVTSQPFFMFLSLFRHYFHVSESDSQELIGEKIQSGYDDISDFLHGEEKQSLLASKALINFLFGIPSEDDRLKARGKDLQ
ncbi:MAG: adenylate/guanylate cyclase domain-containing protein, partial [Candidatus Neomarinimicrobiota bacterium]|nr:adenylate/guanylate cyclase domain-containing protein [Candidatus Neomarinimicrobiota bacterium]